MWTETIMKDELSKRQKIALELLKGHFHLSMASDELMVETINCALDFADLFLDISEDTKDE